MSDNTEAVCSACEEIIAPNSYRNVKVRRTYCRDCWVYWIETKFRRQLFAIGRPEKGTAGQIYQPPEKIVVLFDGSPAAVALINLLADIQKKSWHAADNPSNRPFPYKFILLVIMESDNLGGLGVTERQKKTLKALENWSDSVGQFPIVISSLESPLAGDDNPLPMYLINQGKYKEDIENLENIKITATDDIVTPFNPTANSILETFVNGMKADVNGKSLLKDTLNIFRMNAMVNAAKILNCPKVIVPEDQTRIATKAFTMMSNLRGYQVPDEMSFRTVIGYATVTRPMSEILNEDLIEYLACLPEENVAGLYSTAHKNRKQKIDTVDHLCTEFIRDLQISFPSTVPTVGKIGDKITKRCPAREECSDDATFNKIWAGVKLCSFCQRAISPNFTPDHHDNLNLKLCEGCYEINIISGLNEIIKNSTVNAVLS